MYLAHFKLKKEPFGIVPDPEFLWLGRHQSHVMETLREGIFDRDGCLVLTGDVGTGKTVLVKRLVTQDGLAPVFITVSGPELTGLDFYHVLANEFHMNGRFESRQAFIADFTRMLSKAFGDDRQAILVVDEAQRLTREALKDLGVLADLPSNGKRLLKILLVAQLEFNPDGVLGGKGGTLPEIAARCRLEPLSEEDTQNYIVHRLKVAGREQPLFSPDAVREVHALSKGFPRLINIICDHALLYGYSANLAQIDRGVIEDCSRDLSVALNLDDAAGGLSSPPAAEVIGDSANGSKADPARLGRRSWLYLAAVVLAGAVAFYLILR
jgi:general secretion pathway protein A